MGLLGVLLVSQAIGWQWASAMPGAGTIYQGPRTASSGTITCTFTYDDKVYTTRTACIDASRHELWHKADGHAFVADAALVIDGATLYLARFSDISSGCTLDALDLRTGRVRWSEALVGLGPIDHSKYLNAIQLRIVGNRVVAFGWESAGRYVEARDAVTGASVYHLVVP